MSVSNIEVCRDVVERRTAISFKYEIEDDYEHPSVRPWTEDTPVTGWCLLDMQSANAVVTVHDALSDKNKTEFNSYPIQWMVNTAWELIAKSNA